MSSQGDVSAESFELESRFERVILCERRFSRLVLFEVLPTATGASDFVASFSRLEDVLVRKLSFRTDLCASSLGAAGTWPFARALRGSVAQRSLPSRAAAVDTVKELRTHL